MSAVPGQLPEKTRDGQDWAEWAREWREDPQGKADRLVGQWEAEAKETVRSSLFRGVVCLAQRLCAGGSVEQTCL